MNLTPNPSTLPPMQDNPAPPAAPRRSQWWIIGLVGVAIACFCLLLGVAGSLIFIFNRKASPQVVPPPVQISTEPSLPPASTSLPTLPATRTPAAATASPAGNATQFADDFSDPSSGWYVGSADNYETAYAQGSYAIRIKAPNSYIISTMPGAFHQPVQNIILNVRARSAPGGDGEVGVVCRYQDIDNYYLAAILGDKFYIGKQVDGKWTYLTSPETQSLPDSTPDPQGYFSIGFSCNDAFLVLEINGIGAAHVTDDTFSAGDAGLYVWGGNTKDQSGHYAQGYFDDFSASLPQP